MSRAAAPTTSEQRVPTGGVDAELRVRVLTDDPSGVPVLEIRTYRRAPYELSPKAFKPTDAAVRIQLQFAPVLVEAIKRVADRATRDMLAAPNADQSSLFAREAP